MTPTQTRPTLWATIAWQCQGLTFVDVALDDVPSIFEVEQAIGGYVLQEKLQAGRALSQVAKHFLDRVPPKMLGVIC